MAMTPPRPDDDTLRVASDLLKENGFEAVWEYLNRLHVEAQMRETVERSDHEPGAIRVRGGPQHGRHPWRSHVYGEWPATTGDAGVSVTYGMPREAEQFIETVREWARNRPAAEDVRIAEIDGTPPLVRVSLRFRDRAGARDFRFEEIVRPEGMRLNDGWVTYALDELLRNAVCPPMPAR